MDGKKLPSRNAAILCALISLVLAQTPAPKAKPAKPAAKYELVDLNSATKKQLMSVPGIGNTYAPISPKRT